jgi:hypothetical protein
MNKMRNSKGVKKGGSGPDGKYMEKSWKKIQEHSRPTRSKLIMKNQKGGGFNGGAKKGVFGGNSGKKSGFKKGGPNGKGQFKKRR